MAKSELFLPIQWLPNGRVRFIDQTRLPQDEVWTETARYRDIAAAIRRLAIRGAPLTGIAAAYGLALAALAAAGPDFRAEIEEAAAELRATRPTAVNLSWALDRVLAAAAEAGTAEEGASAVLAAAQRIHEEDIQACLRIGELGAGLLNGAARVITHCNAGALATGGHGTALGIIRAAGERGRLRYVYATETRPLLQGARLTAWELQSEGIPFSLVVDSAAGTLMRGGEVDAVIVGADRIAANGDVANKIGTYALAVLANENSIPFYVAAPTSTIDLNTPNGGLILIEERAAEEVTSIGGRQIAPPGVQAGNPAFDVTPNRYVSAIITERGVARAPYTQSLRALCSAEVGARG
jgi:methylthioribose-1-phosphate isomerase